MDNAMASAGVASVNKKQFIRKLTKFESEFAVHQGPGADGTIPSSRIFTRGELAEGLWFKSLRDNTFILGRTLNHQITKLPNYQITKLPNYQINKLPRPKSISVDDLNPNADDDNRGLRNTTDGTGCLASTSILI